MPSTSPSEAGARFVGFVGDDRSHVGAPAMVLAEQARGVGGNASGIVGSPCRRKRGAEDADLALGKPFRRRTTAAGSSDDERRRYGRANPADLVEHAAIVDDH